MSEVCCGQVWRGYRYSKCDRKAKFEVDGKWYCGIHNPNKAPTKAQIAAEENYKARIKQFRRANAAPALLDALTNLLNRIELEGCTPLDWPEFKDGRAAIKKTTGEQE